MGINDGLIGYWQFENNNTNEIFDSSGNGNNGILINATKEEGKSGNAVSLTGSDDSHASIPASESLNSYTDQFTVTAWVFPTVPPDDFNPVVSRQTGTLAHPDQFFLGFGPQDGIQYKWHLATDTGMLGDIYSGTAEFGRWIHLAGTYDGQIMRLYVDGVEIGNQAISGNIPVDYNPVTIGAEENGDIPLDVLGEFESLIDEVRIYNRALTASEIEEISLDQDLGDLVYREPNDTIELANEIELDSSSPVVVNGEIGDHRDPSISNNDVDLFEVELEAGETLVANIDAAQIGSELDSVLTIFDINGSLLAQNDNNSFGDVIESDSFLTFTAPQNGTYYVGVSSAGNLDYDPTVENSGIGNSSGSYSLELGIDESNGVVLDTLINRFQNRDHPGTYLFAGPEESQSIRDKFPNFIAEGPAFKVATKPGEDLIRMNRFQNSNAPGTYLYAGEAESESIRQNFPNMIEEGVAFYVYDGAANKGVVFYRFQNRDVPGTYIYVGGEERQNIIDNHPNFVLEGIAFEVGI